MAGWWSLGRYSLINASTPLSILLENISASVDREKNFSFIYIYTSNTPYNSSGTKSSDSFEIFARSDKWEERKKERKNLFIWMLIRNVLEQNVQIPQRTGKVFSSSCSCPTKKPILKPLEKKHFIFARKI